MDIFRRTDMKVFNSETIARTSIEGMKAKLGHVDWQSAFYGSEINDR